MKTPKTEKKRRLCSGKRSDGQPCRNPAAPNSDKCARRHNGNAAKGTNSATYRGKGWSKQMPQKLVDRGKELISSPEWLNLTQEILYINVLLSQLAERLNDLEGSPETRWLEFRTVYSSLKQTINEKDCEAAQKHLDRMGQLIKDCSDNTSIEKRQLSLFDKKARLILKQQKIEEKRKMYISLDQMALFNHALYTGIDMALPQANVMVNSLEVRKQLSAHIRRLFNLKTDKNYKLSSEESKPKVKDYTNDESLEDKLEVT